MLSKCDMFAVASPLVESLWVTLLSIPLIAMSGCHSNDVGQAEICFLFGYTKQQVCKGVLGNYISSNDFPFDESVIVGDCLDICMNLGCFVRCVR